MTPSDLEVLLTPLDGDSPAGPNLEYDPEFQALDRAAAPKAEKSIGDSVKAAEEPDWPEVARMAEALFSRTRDLRIAIHLTTAWLHTGSMPGWSAGLELIRGLLENFWDSVYPQLDADDDNDPTFRVNSIAPLGNIQGTLRYFRTAPFVQSQRLGRFSLRDLRIANGSLKLPPRGGDEPAAPLPTMALIEGCCKDCPEQMLVDNTAAIGTALEHAKAIDGLFTDRIGAAGPDLKNLVNDIFDLKKFLDVQLAKRRPAISPEADDDDEDDDIPDTSGKPSSRSVESSGGQISTPQDVIRRLDEICDYYARHEPSSPVPLLLRRAQRLVGKDFLDLLKDLAPSGISQLQVISGSTAAAAGNASAARVPDDDDD